MKYLSAYYRYVNSMALAAIAVYLFASLYSYQKHDPSWFFCSTIQGPVCNWAGHIGAHSGALLFYVFGGAAYIVSFQLLMLAYFVLLQKSIASTFERLIAGAVLVPLGAVVARMHLLDSGQVSVPGGLVGVSLYNFFLATLGAVATVVVVYTSILAATLIVTQLSWVKVLLFRHYIRRGANFFVYACTGVKHYVAQNMIAPAVVGVRFVQKIIDGSILYEEDIIVQQNSFSSKLPEDVAKLADDQQLFDMQQETGFVDKDVQNVASLDVEACASRNAENALLDEEKTQPLGYSLPQLHIFTLHEKELLSSGVKKELEQRAHLLEEKLGHFGISGMVVDIKRGPVVTLFEYQPAIDTKLSKIVALEDDLAMALQALSIRILAPIPGTNVVGFEVANKKRNEVLFSDVVQSVEFTQCKGALPLVLGQDTIGTNVVVDLVRMPHLLIAGSTGSGKSVALNGMLVSLLCCKTPQELRLILIDPKRLEFASYTDIAHLLFPIVTDPKQAAPILRWVVQEMERRYEQIAACGVRSMQEYNLCKRHEGHAQSLYYIVVIIDELADLMMTASREIEDLITRITQMARAAGIHMIVATQRPSVDVITGLIKVNFPSRISFRVTSKIDSRTILDCSGADKLLGRGDMLFLDAHTASLRRVHGSYLYNEEIENVVCHIRKEQPVCYQSVTDFEQLQKEFLLDEDKELYQDVIVFLDSIDELSISLLQRKFKIGYNRSARIMDYLTHQGMIFPADGAKMRKVVR